MIDIVFHVNIGTRDTEILFIVNSDPAKSTLIILIYFDFGICLYELNVNVLL